MVKKKRKIMSQNINTEDVAVLLGVSSATVKNWIKHKYLTPVKNSSDKMVFDEKQVKNLKNKIDSGKITRLNKRANKKSLSNTFVPDEYADNEDIIKLVEKIINLHKNNSLEKEKIIFMLVVNLLIKNNLIIYNGSFDNIKFKNNFIEEEVKWWLLRIKDTNFGQEYSDLLKIELPDVVDFLGLIYQSFSSIGKKSQLGSYYSPEKTVSEMINDYIKENYFILDLCCGTGRFLLSSAGKIKNPNQIWGFDIDEMAVRIARINLITYFSNIDFSPNIYHKNTLLDITSESEFNGEKIPTFDLIISNPPWGFHFSKEDIKKLEEIYPSIESKESFSYFIQKGLFLLKNKGILSFILPESILNIKNHRDIRKIAVKETNILKIKYLGRIFKNVFTPVVRLDISKNEKNNNHKIKAEKNNKVYTINQNKLKKSPNYFFNVFSDNNEIRILDKIYKKKHTTLVGRSEWALGIVTGDNEKYLVDKKTPTNEPILTGKDIKKFTIDEPKKFIDFDISKFQQVAPEVKYRAEEKLIYKFISKNLTFAYDNKKMLTLNSANILIPKIDKYPIKTILALLNSSLYQFIYEKKFGSIKILRGNLEKLPLPLLNQEQHEKINDYTNKLLDTFIPEDDKAKIYKELDKYIFDIFKLDTKEIKLLERN